MSCPNCEKLLAELEQATVLATRAVSAGEKSAKQTEETLIVYKRLAAQVLEALSILARGTDYERLHVAEVLTAGFRS